MARKIENLMINAIRSKDVFRQANNDTGVTHQHVRLHGNLIATIDYTTRYVTLSSCGWTTTTTKSRLNAVLDALGIKGRIYQSKGDWYIDDGVGNAESFFDGICRGF